MSKQTTTIANRSVSVGRAGLPGTLSLPEKARGLVVFVHGSGSSRLSPRNRHVAQALNAYGFATLLFDLLTDRESADREAVFDISLLADRVSDALAWARAQSDVRGLSLGLFGASTGAAAALVAAAKAPSDVQAIVSRGGRPDLAGAFLPRVRAPSLLIVGGADFGVIALNERAFAQLDCVKRLEIVPGATHLFEEPGTLDQVIALASGWFARHLVSDPA